MLADEKPQSTALQIALATGLTHARKGPLFDTPAHASARFPGNATL